MRWIPLLAAAAVPLAQAAGDYVGTLKPMAAPSAIAIPEPGFYWQSAEPFGSRLGAPMLSEGFKFKLGYRYSRYFSVETGYADAGPGFLNSGSGATAARGRGFSMDTVGTLPLWTHASLYGRLGAWRSDPGVSLLAGDVTPRPGAGLRYGLGLKYDLTRRVGVQAEMERFSPLDRWGANEADTDNQITLGVRWRF